MRAVVALLLGSVSASLAGTPTVLVTGATGGTGQLLYAQLVADTRVAQPVRALVHGNASDPAAKAKAAKALNCTQCDESEGVYYGDVTDPASMRDAMHGVTTVAIAVGAGFTLNSTLQKAIEFTGVENQVSALAGSGGSLEEKRVVLCSSMATTNPHPSPFEGGPILFWKLNAEERRGHFGDLFGGFYYAFGEGDPVSRRGGPRGSAGWAEHRARPSAGLARRVTHE